MSEPQIIPIFVIYTTIDEYGRLGSVVGYARTQQAADEAAKGKGWWGGPGSIKKGKALVLDGKIYPLMSDGAVTFVGEPPAKDWKAIRREALAKLSADERKALNVKDFR